MTPRNASDDLTDIVEIGFVLLAIGVAWALSRFWLYPALGVPAYAPLILRPVLGFLTAWWLISRTGRAWSDFGLARPRSLISAAIAAVLLYGAAWVLLNYVAPYIADAVGAESAPSILGYIRGHAVAFVGWIVISWLIGAFAEELLFRGFLLNGVARAIGHAGWGLGLGVVAQAVLFGMLHLYQGTFGFVMAGLFALLFGAAYLLTGRNLWPLVLAHGGWNTVGIANVYFSTPSVVGS